MSALPLALPLTLPGERKTCPICDGLRVRLASSGLELVREYRCGDCGARWAVEGRQTDSLTCSARRRPPAACWEITNVEHEHSDAYHQTNADNQTLEWKARLRQHVKDEHGASDDWAAMVDADLIAERHNFDHGRDARGGLGTGL